MKVTEYRYSDVCEVTSIDVPDHIIIKKFGSLDRFEKQLKDYDDYVIEWIEEGNGKNLSVEGAKWKVTHLMDMGEVETEYFSATYPKWKGKLVDEVRHDDSELISNIWKGKLGGCE